MNAKIRQQITDFVRENIVDFHKSRIENLDKLGLPTLLANKNPYLFKAKNLNVASDLINALLQARLSSSEEGSFGTFLEELAVFVAKICGGGQKAAIAGLDIDLTRGGVRYLIAVKSGKNWGNSGQHKDLRANFKNAVRIVKQSKQTGQIQPTLGICYGKFKTVDNGEYLHIGGQSFWHLLSDDAELYVDIVEPLGHEAENHEKLFAEKKDNTFNRLTREFTLDYCDTSGAIEWGRLVRFVSENLESAQAAPHIAVARRKPTKKPRN
jgi:hypothetical protein